MKKKKLSIYDVVGNLSAIDTIGAASRLEGMLSSLMRSYPALSKLKTPRTLEGYTSTKRAGMSQADVSKSFVDFWLSRVVTEQNKLYSKYERKQQESEFGGLLPKISSPVLNQKNLTDIAIQTDLLKSRGDISVSEAFDRFVNSVSIEAMRTQEKVTKYLDPSAYRKTLTAGERDFILSKIISGGKFNISEFKSDKKYGSLVLLSYANLAKAVSNLGYNEIYGLISQGLITPSDAKYLWNAGGKSGSLTYNYNTKIDDKNPEDVLFSDFLNNPETNISNTRLKKIYNYLKKNEDSELLQTVEFVMIRRGL